MKVSEIIHQKLVKSLSPVSLEIIDESHKHAGHAGSRPGGQSHFNVVVVSDAFEGKSRVQRQRLVYQAISEEMSGIIHALALKTLTPDEAQKN